ncbi:hypothetical protein TRIATDRAFT_297078 [Trichoderma atroviride IMI 206040]|uniref:Uncharacterized protein n=1 Tax=Hypocrea atroviridis (strain ATCC 20476 / IMI 206040) TaxID=452589 RepID=G9NFK5_HYPAI|nr:uncharacterized protein TRIATDRAFT_297078 [Trichoderma atroviride IMI 206040]EHK50720.1 hypothetical protein TRIATDRAFT_297078 [Trichoderma atroviride IMI 206040]
MCLSRMARPADVIVQRHASCMHIHGVPQKNASRANTYQYKGCSASCTSNVTRILPAARKKSRQCRTPDFMYMHPASWLFEKGASSTHLEMQGESIIPATRLVQVPLQMSFSRRQCLYNQ